MGDEGGIGVCWVKPIPSFQVGSLLLPNEYLRASSGNPRITRTDPIFGVILQVREGILEDFEYELFLSNGNRTWKHQFTIHNLFDVYCCTGE
jgi:hypothetical protein